MSADLFSSPEPSLSPTELAPGLVLFRNHLQDAAQSELLESVRQVARIAPLFLPTMPGTGKPFSVKMTNCGPLGWVADRAGYRYQAKHPETGLPWPPIPAQLLDLWRELSQCAADPQACLVNFYEPNARMGLHQDKDELDFAAPVLSVSLGDACLFRYGGTTRKDPTRSIRLDSGDVLVIGGPSRLCFHGVDRIYAGTSALLKQAGRINLTLRRVGIE